MKLASYVANGKDAFGAVTDDGVVTMNGRLGSRYASLRDALTADGHTALGWPDAGRIAVGQRADLVAVRLDSPRTAGVLPAQAVMAAGAADVHVVVVDGRVVVRDGRHVLGDVGQLLRSAIAPLWEAA